MAPLTTFTLFEELPVELQMEIYQEAIIEEHNSRVVPVLNSTKRVVLTPDVMRDSKFFSLCKVAQNVAKSIYDCELQVTQNKVLKTIHLSTKRDIFLVGPWQYTIGINLNSGPGLFPQSLSALSPTALSKVKRVMEHQLDLGDLVYQPTPNFDQMVYSSVVTCFIRVDHARPTIQSLTAQIGGALHTQLDLLSHYTTPSIYQELTNLEGARHNIEDESGVVSEDSQE